MKYTDKNDIKNIYYIWLGSVLPNGSPSIKTVLEYFKSIEKIYKAERKELLDSGISEKDAMRLCDKDLEEAERYYDYCKREHIGLLLYDDPYYPERLKSISNPPALFYYRGRVKMLDDYPCFAMVGTRSCSEKGFRLAYKTGYKTASFGGVVVNGLALGIDSACIRGALDADAYCVGLLGCGIDRIYPSQNKDLFCRLSSRGLILSEFAPFTRPEGRNFPIRNRVMSALSVAAVIFEADASSGALITANHALSQGRRIFAVPGDVTNALYEGPLGLIKNGAQVFTEAEDFVSEYSLSFPHRIKIGEPVKVPENLCDEAVRDAFGRNPAKEEKEETLPEPKKIPKKKNTVTIKAEKSKPKEEKLPKNEIFSVKVEKTAEKPMKKEEKPVEETELKLPPIDLTGLSTVEIAIYELFKKHEILTVDEIVSQGIKTDDTLSSLTLLEVYGAIEMLPGGRYKLIKL